MIETPPEPPAESAQPHAPALSFTAAWTVFAMTVFLVVGFSAQLIHLAWGLWFSEIVLFAGLAIIGFQLLGLKALPAMGLERFDARSFGLGFAFGAVNYLAWAVPLMAAAQAIFPKSMVDQFDSARVFDRATPVELALVLAGVSIAAPLGEELFFRGFMQRGLEVHRGSPRAIVVTAFVFSAFHLDPVGLTARFELGVLFGLLAWRAGSLWPAIAAHAANNLISAVIFLAAGDEAREADLDWRVPVGLLIVGNAVLVAMVRSSWSRLPVSRPMRFEQTTPRSPVSLFVPWLVGGLASLGLLLAVDFRGVQLNVMDLRLMTTKEIREREEVKALRAKARRGDVPLEDYEAKVKSLKALPLPSGEGRGEG